MGKPGAGYSGTPLPKKLEIKRKVCAIDDTWSGLLFSRRKQK